MFLYISLLSVTLPDYMDISSLEYPSPVEGLEMVYRRVMAILGTTDNNTYRAMPVGSRCM